MLTLKDIKISRNRIPLQNAIWLRPIGGLKFKIYYPHGGEWAELGTTSSSSDDSGSSSGKGSDSVTPTTKDTSYKKSARLNDCGRVIVCKAIPEYPRAGDHYFFADGFVKFRDENGKIKAFDYETHEECKIKVLNEEVGITFQRYSSESGFNGLFWPCPTDTHRPILVTAVKGSNTIDTVKISKANHLNCSTASPHFIIVNGYLKCIKVPSVPELGESLYQKRGEISKLRLFLKRKRSPKVRNTKVWNWANLNNFPQLWLNMNQRIQYKKVSQDWKMNMVGGENQTFGSGHMYYVQRFRVYYYETTYKSRKTQRIPIIYIGAQKRFVEFKK